MSGEAHNSWLPPCPAEALAGALASLASLAPCSPGGHTSLAAEAGRLPREPWRLPALRSTEVRGAGLGGAICSQLRPRAPPPPPPPPPALGSRSGGPGIHLEGTEGVEEEEERSPWPG